jgi:PAS domain S-box-containing protein
VSLTAIHTEKQTSSDPETTTLPPGRPQHPLRHIAKPFARYLAAVVATLLAFLIRAVFVHRYGSFPPYITFFPAVLFVALATDLWAGLLATGLAALIADYWILPPTTHFAIASRSDQIGLAFFCLSSIGVSVVVELYHRNREKFAIYRVDEAIRLERAKLEESQRLTEAARAERQRFLNLLETLPSGICLFNADYRIVFANQAFRQKYPDAVGERCYSACFGRSAPCDMCETYQVLETGKPHRWEIAYPDGVVTDAFDVPFTDSDGTRLILRMDVDITERRRAEADLNHYREHLELMVETRTQELQSVNEALKAELAERKIAEQSRRQSEERLRLLTDNLPNSVVFQFHRPLEGEPRFLYLSAGVERTNGFRPEEVLEDPAIIFRQMLPEEYPGYMEAVLASQRDLTIFEREIRARMSDGSIRWLHILSRPRRLPDGSTVWDGVQTDVTARVLADNAFRLTKQRFELALRSSPVVVFQQDLDLRYSWIYNPALGYQASEVLGKRDADLFERAEEAALTESIKADVIRTEVGQRREVNIHWHGVNRVYDLLVEPLHDESGQIAGVTCAAIDITERKSAEEALLRSEKLASVARMATSVAHEINNPLAAIMNMLYLARASTNNPALVIEYLDMAEDELKRIAHITRQTLGFYSETSAPVRTSLDGLIDSALTLLNSRIRSREAHIIRRGVARLHLTVVPGELRQVCCNLLVNSLDAIDDGGAVELRVSTAHCGSAPAIRITIADNGRGIDNAIRPHIFEPLFTTKPVTGSGLGLWVARQLIEKRGGSIRVRSCTSGPRRGTIFSILIPRT